MSACISSLERSSIAHWRPVAPTIYLIKELVLVCKWKCNGKSVKCCTLCSEPFLSSSHVLFVVNSHKIIYICVMKVFAKDLTIIVLIFILLLSC
jgi:hypothetical protein